MGITCVVIFSGYGFLVCKFVSLHQPWFAALATCLWILSSVVALRDLFRRKLSWISIALAIAIVGVAVYSGLFNSIGHKA